MDEQTYAPEPGEIKKVILVTYGDQGKDQIKTYENLLEAATAVYRLDAEATMALWAILSPKERK
ncbi:MAG: hypothetical protein IT327_07580 [Anaerolineae bacterium]|nr:hypothetical protein [Anaerolineae bacterium]